MLKLLKFNTNSHLKKNKTLRVSTSYTHATSVGIIYTVEDKKKHEYIKDFIKRIEHDGKKVSVMTFLPGDKQSYEFMFDFFTEKEVSFWGDITSPSAIQFANTPFDFLFYLDTEPNPLILNLLARSKARCRIGKFWEGGKSYLEFMIETSDNTKGLMDGLYKYSSLLQ